jgi:transcriptional regulator with GAF, ATPase, and Fis domain/tRNA A-37 threonylcarbamoyl transferase component Bud32
VLERYELKRLLGQGAAGDVYLASDRLLGGREVALKRIAARVDESLRRAFEREFATMASLSIPGVAQVHDFGVMQVEGSEGRTFYTRAYIDGRPLDQACATATPAQRVRLLVEVAHVIALMHRVGVVHGDIKPGNAIVDARGAAHVIDFGLSRVMGQARGEEASGGTLPFMAPELLHGAAPSVQSDVFALGVTLWFLLTAEYPFGRKGMLEPSGARRLAVPEGADGVTRAALEVATRALARDPLDRLPTVAELIAALDDVAPPGAERASRRVFVPPRPRGHAELLGRLQTSIMPASAQPSGTQALLVVAPAGGGKSLLLRELKWRMQIRAAQVLELAVDGDVKASLAALVRQLEVALGGDARASASLGRARVALQAARIEQSEFAEALGEAFGWLSGRGPVVVSIDDIDRGEALTLALLRSAIFADAQGAVTVVATATDRDAPAVRELSAGEAIEIPPLSRIESQALVTDALGAVDASVLDALYEHSKGLPAALIDALASLWELPAPTVADVRKLPPLGASLALARARLSRLPAGERELLAVLSLLGRVESTAQLTSVLSELGVAGEVALDRLAHAEELGLLARRADGLGIAEPALEKALSKELGEDGVRALAQRVLDASTAEIGLGQRARLAVLAADVERMRELVPAAGEALVAMGAHGAAAELYEALLERSEGACEQRAMLTLARCRHALGELERAEELAARLLARADLDPELRADAAIVSAQALTGLGRFDEAVATLSLVPEDAAPQARARVQRELANVHLRRGDYGAVQAAAEAGLACVEDDVVRSELLCARGMVASYRAEHALAREILEQAVSLAHRAGAAREEAGALAALAISCFRTGDLLSARDLFAQCLEVARRIGDIGSMANSALNLGVLLFSLGEPAAAAEHYESAARLSSRAGRMATYLQARCNLAHLHIYFGLYERAKVEVGRVLDDARDAKRKYIRAQATALLGDLSARAGDVERALIHYDDAIARYAELGQMREVAEHHLDAADVLLDRGGPADASAAAARLASARGPIEREKLGDLGLRLQLSLARTRLSSGEAEGALASLQEVIDEARAARSRDVEWCAAAAAAQAHELLGAAFAARRFQRVAVEVLEDIALRVPREHREAFWHDPRRRAARERAIEVEESTHRGGAAPLSDGGDLQTLMGDARAARLLDIIKRLASEHDLDRLLERITESAVDLSGAERGYVLLVDKSGQLEKRTEQVKKAEDLDPHAAFSRSIAEAVLIDGDPIVTVDATRDGRLSEYVSVHKLMLRSVACLPIHGRSGPVGVLYLEHRQSRGRFSEASVTLLHAFADQAAIALENARLMAENARRQEELQQANLALEKAKQDLEELLSARTEELLQAQRELTETRRSASSRATRHGMVGRSAAMLRVFDTIDRVQGAKVPVIIQGESGTGKELVARAIHQAGPRAKAPFVVVNCGSLSENLLESELFGHVAGAFSGAERDKRGLIARASGGTLFLDEVSDMPPKMQINLLRVLQEGSVCKVGGDEEERVDVRVIAASHHQLEDLVQAGRFREDLYYRLNVVEITVPPLRERREDIPLLCQHFLSGFAERDGLPEKRLSRDALDRLARSALRGNVRQLEHVLLQAWVMVEGGVIDAGDLALDAEPQADAGASALESSLRPPAIECLDDYRAAERRKILAALEEHGWNRVRAAKALGMPRRTFYRRLQEHHILERAEAG